MTFPLEKVRKSVNPTSIPTYKPLWENVSRGRIFSTSYVMHTNHFPFSFRIVASLILPSMSRLCLTSMYPILFKRNLPKYGSGLGVDGSFYFPNQPYYPMIIDGERRFPITPTGNSASNYVGIANNNSADSFINSSPLSTLKLECLIMFVLFE